MPCSPLLVDTDRAIGSTAGMLLNFPKPLLLLLLTVLSLPAASTDNLVLILDASGATDGTVDLNDDIDVEGTQTIAGNVALQTSINIVSGGLLSGTVDFSAASVSAVAASTDLSITANTGIGTATVTLAGFDNAAGANVDDLAVTSTDINLGANITTTATQNFDGDVNLTASLALTGTDVSVTGQTQLNTNNLTLDVTGSGSTLFLPCPGGEVEADLLAQQLDSHLIGCRAIAVQLV